MGSAKEYILAAEGDVKCKRPAAMDEQTSSSLLAFVARSSLGGSLCHGAVPDWMLWRLSRMPPQVAVCATLRVG